MQTRKAHTLNIRAFTENSFAIVWGEHAERVVTLWNCPTFFLTQAEAEKALADFAARKVELT